MSPFLRNLGVIKAVLVRRWRYILFAAAALFTSGLPVVMAAAVGVPWQIFPAACAIALACGYLTVLIAEFLYRL
jgi:hypothetical protein